MSGKLWTLVGFPPGNIPTVLLEKRPFQDCYTVGLNFLSRETLRACQGTSTLAAFAVPTETTETVTNDATKGEYRVLTRENKLFGKATLAKVILVEG